MLVRRHAATQAVADSWSVRAGGIPSRSSPDWTFAGVPSYTVRVATSRSDTRLLLTATAAVVLAGVVVAVVLLFASGRSSSPKQYAPFRAGPEKEIARELREGGPFFFPDPFGGDKSVLFALEDGRVVALSNVLPGTRSCVLRWRGSIDRFEDCRGGRHTSTELDRFRTAVDAAGPDKGILKIDLRRKIAAPAA
jgi:hypothetical protein